MPVLVKGLKCFPVLPVNISAGGAEDQYLVLQR